MRLASLPRVPLAHLPTPLEEAPRLSAALGGPRILIKRDDLTGLALGGNKTRKLEYLMADAQAQGATAIITVGGTQSNHCRQTAAAARLCGLRCVLVLNASEGDPSPQGNLLLDQMLGAEIRLIADTGQRAAAIQAATDDLLAQGERPYVIPGGGSNPVGASAYVAAVFEITDQLARAGWDATHLYTTSSTSGGTHAGLALGAALVDAPFEIVGIAIEDTAPEIVEVVLPLANATSDYLEAGVRLTATDLTVDDRFVGAGYAVPTGACLDAIRLAARSEALLLDPVYTAKTMAGLMGHIREGRLGPDDTVIFLHSGGTPALFAQADIVAAAMRG